MLLSSPDPGIQLVGCEKCRYCARDWTLFNFNLSLFIDFICFLFSFHFHLAANVERWMLKTNEMLSGWFFSGHFKCKLSEEKINHWFHLQLYLFFGNICWTHPCVLFTEIEVDTSSASMISYHHEFGLRTEILGFICPIISKVGMWMLHMRIVGS